MKKIYESPLNGWDESAEKIYVYALEDEKEWWEFDTMSHDERCQVFNVHDESGYDIMPGAMYHRYEFELTGSHIVMIETTAINV